jgi:hypothetical protein
MIRRQIGIAAAVVLTLILCAFGISAIQGDCGSATLLESITASPRQIADEKRAMNAWLASSGRGRQYSAESISGHELMLRDHAASMPRWLSNEASQSILMAWVSVLQHEQHLTRPPAASIYLYVHGARGTSIRSSECQAL